MLREIGDEWERGTLALSEAVAAIGPQLVVVAAVDPARLEAAATGLRRVARKTRLVLSGPGASEAVGKRLRIERLNGDLVAAAAAV